ncbi:hypothetical protein IQ219_12335 [Synechocystis sp. LEGE 06083]|uniref:hypothetical protein n=1 Tax=Synechocystis sp. LEGE 06083 TaxID=915336 RepID=UPI001882F115|nr:hypothetical protein [Synechocystis sp. LEGE 06083]MBE9196076.1 hypothetical protein [Synechocystis sp. LEGE 06083]
MVSATSSSVENLDFSHLRGKDRKITQIIEKTYHNNTESDYTEKIEQLEKAFNYSVEKDYYWGSPELSFLYGTPLYEQSSESQRKVLNHLYWIGQYNLVAASETSTILFNQVTANVFFSLGGFDSLCHELDLETNQERYHIHAFQNIDRIVQEGIFGNADVNGDQYRKQTLDVLRDGVARYMGSDLTLKFLSINWGSTPFLASQYYCARYIANISLKNKEQVYSLHCRKLQKSGAHVPAPTAISRYHLLDESFHTTISQLLGKELYKEFAKPSAYEKFLMNTVIYNYQKHGAGSLSGLAPGAPLKDELFMPVLYSVLRSSVFGMSTTEALDWIEKCACSEHKGFHVSLEYVTRLLNDLRRFFSTIDYLWPVNKEWSIMAEAHSIPKTLKANRRAFNKFARTV